MRSIIIGHCLHDHGVKLHAHGIVIMPDHVHMIFTPLKDALGNVFGLTEIVGSMKRASAHSLNKVLKRRGPVWQREYFDHILRSDESTASKVQYICENAVRHGIVEFIDDYLWLWREWVEGQEIVAPPPPAAKE